MNEVRRRAYRLEALAQRLQSSTPRLETSDGRSLYYAVFVRVEEISLRFLSAMYLDYMNNVEEVKALEIETLFLSYTRASEQELIDELIESIDLLVDVIKDDPEQTENLRILADLRRSTIQFYEFVRSHGYFLRYRPISEADFVTEEGRRKLWSDRKLERPIDLSVEGGEYRVWFATNRVPIDIDDVTKGFSGERDTRTHFGWCRILIPKFHRIGSIGSPWWRRVLTGTDDRLRLLDITTADETFFWRRLHGAAINALGDEKEAVVFVHGYHVSFEEAALRAAQIGCDLSIRGVMALFSWPSKGTLEGYCADSATIEASEPAIKEFLMRIAAEAGVERVNVIAHSMGNRGVLGAISRIATEVKEATGKEFAQFILAAADVDSDTFVKSADSYRKLGGRTTLYVSSRDLAVELSSWIHDSSRIGFTPPVTVLEGIDTVSVAKIDLTLLGHSYVAEARGVLEDMHELIKTRAAPDQRFALRRALTPEGAIYWEIAS